MQRPGYERFALVSNPFHDLASESLDETEVYHVTQEADEAFERMKQEVLEGTRKSFVLIVGPLGSGKTQRLRVTAGQADAVEAFSLFLNLGEAPPDPVAAIAEGLAKAVQERKLAKGFSPPRWSKDLQAIAKGKALNPETAGRTIAEALNALAPSYLLLNDIDALHGEPEARILQTMLAMVSHIHDGVLVAVACQRTHFNDLNKRAGPLMSRVNRVLELRGLTNEEAELLLAKRMAGRRLIEDLDPTYPFTPAAVAELNRAGDGSPRRLLQLADLILDSAVKERAFQIGPELVLAGLARAGAIVENQPVTGPTVARPMPAKPLATKPMPASPVPLKSVPVQVKPRQTQPPPAAAPPVAVGPAAPHAVAPTSATPVPPAASPPEAPGRSLPAADQVPEWTPTRDEPTVITHSPATGAPEWAVIVPTTAQPALAPSAPATPPARTPPPSPQTNGHASKAAPASGRRAALARLVRGEKAKE